MRFSLSVLATLVPAALGGVVPRAGNDSAPAIPDTDYDAVVIGGGPSGLSAVSGLARVRRNVLVIDSGEYRNGATRHMHDVIGFDGVTPAYYRYAARELLSHYDTVSFTNGTVTSIKPHDNNTWFTIDSEGTETVTARKVILGTGLRDLLPDTPGVKENWGQGIYWCPWCDGHEHADQGLGLLAGLEEIAVLVREMRTLNKDIVAFVNGTDTPENREKAEEEFPQWEKYLKIHKVEVINDTISSLNRLRNGSDPNADPSLPSYPELDLFRVDFEGDHKPVERGAFLTGYENEQASWIGRDVGVELEEGRYVADNAKGHQTNIPGIYAIGDANNDMVTNVPHALVTGKRTAVFVHVQLEREQAAFELDNFDEKKELEERDNDLNIRDLWERMNGAPGELLYAGEFEE